MDKLQWMTVPEWAQVRQTDLRRREQDAVPVPDTGAPRNFHVLVRGAVTLPEGEYTLRVSADDYYFAWVDGSFLGCGPAQGGFWQEYPMAGGAHTLALHLYYHGLVSRSYDSGDGCFGVALDIVKDGAVAARCGGDWRYTVCHAWSGESVGYDTQFLENFDSRLYPEGWQEPDFDDSGWGHLLPAQWEKPLHPQKSAAVQWYSREPEKVIPIPGGILLDFGREITGQLRCRAEGAPGEVITLRYAEELQDGRAWFDTRCGCRYEESWTLGGSGKLHQFDYKAFRYAEVLFGPGVRLPEVGAWVRHYPMEDGLCTLVCPAGELDRIFEICKNAVRCCAQESFLDCPTREKGQYLGDSVITARSHLWLTGKNDLLRKCIRDFTATAEISPGLMAVAPGSFMQEIADHSLLFPELVWTDYEFTGDREFLRECYPAVVGLTAEFSRYERPDGLLENVSAQWNLADWPEGCRDGYDFPLTRPVVGEGCHNVINALWVGAWQTREKMERCLGIPAAGRWETLGRAFRDAFYRPEQNLYADSEKSAHCALHSNIYAAYFGLCPDESRFEALMLEPGRHCGVFPMYFALRALARMGKRQTVYRLLTRTDSFGWRNMLREGASACFEVWGREQKWNTSLCHAWASAPISIIIEELAGLHPTPDGFDFRPVRLTEMGQWELNVPLRGKRYRIVNSELEEMHHAV